MGGRDRRTSGSSQGIEPGIHSRKKKKKTRDTTSDKVEGEDQYLRLSSDLYTDMVAPYTHIYTHEWMCRHTHIYVVYTHKDKLIFKRVELVIFLLNQRNI